MNIKERFESCKKIFVTWYYLVTAMILLSGTIAGISYKYAIDKKNTENKIINIENKISTIERIETKIDTIIVKLRE